MEAEGRMIDDVLSDLSIVGEGKQQSLSGANGLLSIEEVCGAKGQKGWDELAVNAQLKAATADGLDTNLFQLLQWGITAAEKDVRIRSHAIFRSCIRRLSANENGTQLEQGRTKLLSVYAWSCAQAYPANMDSLSLSEAVGVWIRSMVQESSEVQASGDAEGSPALLVLCISFLIDRMVALFPSRRNEVKSKTKEDEVCTPLVEITSYAMEFLPAAAISPLLDTIEAGLMSLDTDSMVDMLMGLHQNFRTISEPHLRSRLNRWCLDLWQRLPIPSKL